MSSTASETSGAPSKTRFVATTFPENTIPTSFSAPASCSAVYWTNGVYAIDNNLDCVPPKFNTASSAFYSPGVVCPPGYTAPPRCSRSDAVSSITTVTCCPYRTDPALTLECVENDLTLSSKWATQFCTWNAGSRPTVIPFTWISDGTPIQSQATMSSREGVNAWGVRMVYQASDAASMTSGSTVGVTQTGTAGPSTTSDGGGGGGGGGEGSEGLSTGAVVAIAVVVPVVVIAALAGLFLWWRKKKHQYAGVKQGAGEGHAPGQHGANAHPNNNFAPSEMAGGNVTGYYQHDKSSVSPAPQGQTGYPQYAGPTELPVAHAPAELPADGHGR